MERPCGHLAEVRVCKQTVTHVPADARGQETQLCSDDVLWTAGQGSHLLIISQHTGPTVGLLSKTISRRCHITHPPHQPISPGQKGELCEVAVHWLQLSVKHHSSLWLKDLGLNKSHTCSSLTSWWADRRWWQSVDTPFPPSSFKPEHTKAAYWAPGCTTCTHDWVASFSFNAIIKFADDTAMVDLIKRAILYCLFMVGILRHYSFWSFCIKSTKASRGRSLWSRL